MSLRLRSTDSSIGVMPRTLVASRSAPRFSASRAEAMSPRLMASNNASFGCRSPTGLVAGAAGARAAAPGIASGGARGPGCCFWAAARLARPVAITGEFSTSCDHAAEAVTGFFTKYGDGGTDILPLSGLTKRQGKQLLAHLGAPARLYEKAPTADLLDLNPGQTDEDNLGLTYADIDDFLEGKDVADEVAEALEARYRATEHKRQPPAILSMASASLMSFSVTPPASWVESETSTFL